MPESRPTVEECDQFLSEQVKQFLLSRWAGDWLLLMGEDPSWVNLGTMQIAIDRRLDSE